MKLGDRVLVMDQGRAIQLDKPEAVSYTHLDVYKRQVVIPIKLQGGQNPGGFLSDIAKLVLRMFAPIYKPILRKKESNSIYL